MSLLPIQDSWPSPQAAWHSLGLKGDGSIVAWGDNCRANAMSLPPIQVLWLLPQARWLIVSA